MSTAVDQNARDRIDDVILLCKRNFTVQGVLTLVAFLTLTAVGAQLSSLAGRVKALEDKSVPMETPR